MEAVDMLPGANTRRTCAIPLDSMILSSKFDNNDLFIVTSIYLVLQTISLASFHYVVQDSRCQILQQLFVEGQWAFASLTVAFPLNSPP